MPKKPVNRVEKFVLTLVAIGWAVYLGGWLLYFTHLVPFESWQFTFMALFLVLMSLPLLVFSIINIIRIKRKIKLLKAELARLENELAAQIVIQAKGLKAPRKKAKK